MSNVEGNHREALSKADAEEAVGAAKEKQGESNWRHRLQGFLFHLDKKFTLVLLTFGIAGIALILVAIARENHLDTLDSHVLTVFVKEMGILLFAVVTTTLVHDRFLRSHSLKEVKLVFNEHVDKLINEHLPAQITKVISEQLPPRYANIKESGIVDALPDLKADKLLEKIRNLDKDSEVFILKIWLTGIDTLESAMKEAVSKGCRFKIIILHPDAVEVFRKRGKFLKGTSIDSEIMRDRVIDSIKRLKLLKESIVSKSARDNLEIKLHRDFVSASIFGFDSEIRVGFYLHNIIAENNIQLRINGKNTRYYKAFKSHFDLQWNSDTNMSLEEYTPPERVDAVK